MEKSSPKEYAQTLIEEIKKLEITNDINKIKKIAFFNVKLIKAQLGYLEEEFFDFVEEELNIL